MKHRSLSLIACVSLLFVAGPALADCPSDTILRLPTAREGALGYSKTDHQLYVCTGTTWVNTMSL